MIRVDDIHIRLGAREVLRGVSLNIRDGECLAVVGPNGCGKTTLLRLIAGRMRPDRGTITMPNAWTVGYLPQEADVTAEHSLMDELRDAFAEAQAALDEMTVLEHEMAVVDPTSAEHDRILHRYGECQHLVEHYDSHTIEPRIRRVAAGLGFRETDLARSCREFSGGWQMRILLAKLLLRDPDVLLLDEPTNHLDLETTLWLEQWIARCGRTVVMVSHERATMDRLAHRIVCLEQGRADIYTGDYSSYLVQSEAKRAQHWAAYEEQQKQIASMEAFIRRFRATASRARLVQSRIKQLERMERIEQPFHPTAIHFNFPQPPHSHHDVIKLRNLGHAYGDLRVFSGLDLTICRGERVGLVGVNGAGKSTLLRLIAGREQPTEGECTIGGKVELAYFAQYDAETLTSTMTVLEALQSTAPFGQAQKARNVAGAFLFSGDDAEKPLAALSGGERTRLRLARMLFSPVNLLLLDEPTNHLDVSSRATVERALEKYTGTVIVVSHDRVFMDRATDRIIELDRGVARTYPGTYSDYLAWKERVLAEQADTGEESGPQPAVHARPIHQPATKEERVRQRQEHKATARKRRALERRVESLEGDIGQHEARLSELDAAMADRALATDHDELARLAAQRTAAAEKHNRLLAEWEKTQEQIEALGNGEG
ncbi:MAG: ABC-F family ATP-binding cassette domain-containing protein [Verrucomicrobia bacterium]|nr:ABC-F family ATP-binding cassette domain-containing protein [Verrucomicrobiota bacterium]